MVSRDRWWCRGRAALLALVALAAFVTSACTSELGGRASFPLVSAARLSGTKIADVDEERCFHQVLFFFGFGEDSNHEALVTDLLERHGGDAIVNAELTFTLIPALVYQNQCARITGTVIRRGPAVSVAPAAASPAEDEP
jgi:hypothetical protein